MLTDKDTRIETELNITQRLRWYAARGTAIGMACVISPLVAIFWQRLMARSLKQILRDNDFSVTHRMDIAIQTVTACFALAKFLADETAINPIYIADYYVFLKRHSNYYSTLTQWTSLPLRLLAAAFVYFTFSSLAVLPLAELGSIGLTQKEQISYKAINYAVVVIFGLSYAWMFNKEQFERNLDRCLYYLQQLPQNIHLTKRYADRLLEIMISNALRAGMPAAIAAFTVFEITQHIFRGDPRHPAARTFAIISAFVTFAMAFLLRAPKKIEQYFRTVYESLNIENVDIPSTPLIFKNLLPSILRGGSVAAIALDMSERHLTRNHWALAAIAIPIFMLVCIPTFLIKYKMAKFELAVSSGSMLFGTISDEDLSANPSSSSYSLSVERRASSIDRGLLFEDFATGAQCQPKLFFNTYAYVASIAVQILQLVCLYFILSAINAHLNLNLRAISIIGLSILFGALGKSEVVITTKEAMCQSRANQNAAYHIEMKRNAIEGVHMFFQAKRVVMNRAKAWLVSPVRYSTEDIVAATPVALKFPSRK